MRRRILNAQEYTVLCHLLCQSLESSSVLLSLRLCTTTMFAMHTATTTSATNTEPSTTVPVPERLMDYTAITTDQLHQLA